jgi:hypothetical protein
MISKSTMPDNINDGTIVALRLIQIPEEEFSKQIVKYIVDNQFPFYPENYVKTINLKTGVQQEKVRQNIQEDRKLAKLISAIETDIDKKKSE